MSSNASFKKIALHDYNFIFCMCNLQLYILLDNLKNCHGQYSESQVSKYNKTGRTFGKTLENVFQNELIQSYNPKASATGDSFRKFKKFAQRKSK